MISQELVYERLRRLELIIDASNELKNVGIRATIEAGGDVDDIVTLMEHFGHETGEDIRMAMAGVFDDAYALQHIDISRQLTERNVMDNPFAIVRTHEEIRELMESLEHPSFTQIAFERLGLTDPIARQDFIDKLSNIFVDALTEGTSINDLTRRLMRATDYQRYQAKRIAQTETMRYANHARKVCADDIANTYGVRLNKRWYSALMETTRDPHRDADRQEVGKDEKFDVGGELLMYPLDPRGSPENTINCHCSHVYIVPRQTTQAVDDIRQKQSWISNNREEYRRLSQAYQARWKVASEEERQGLDFWQGINWRA